MEEQQDSRHVTVPAYRPTDISIKIRQDKTYLSDTSLYIVQCTVKCLIVPISRNNQTKRHSVIYNNVRYVKCEIFTPHVHLIGIITKK